MQAILNANVYEHLEERLLMKCRVLAAENARLAGAKTFTQEEADERFRKRYGN